MDRARWRPWAPPEPPIPGNSRQSLPRDPVGGTIVAEDSTVPPDAQLALLPDALTRPAPAGVTTPARAVPPLALDELAARARAYFKGARSERTRRAYAGDWHRFAAWCVEQGRAAFPADPETVALYLAHLAAIGRKRATLVRARAAIAVAHRQDAQLDRPCPTKHALVVDVMKGIARAHGAPPERAPALRPDELEAMLTACPTDLRGARDRALLALGFAGAFRRAALVSLDVRDLAFVERGLEVLVRADKSDPTREGRRIPIAHAAVPARCPVAAVRAWLERAALRDTDPLFVAVGPGGRVGRRLRPRAVDRVVKKAAARAGLQIAGLSSHSLRAGFITAAIRQKHPLERIRVVSGHKEGSRAFEAYVRFAGLWDAHAGEGVL